MHLLIAVARAQYQMSEPDFVIALQLPSNVATESGLQSSSDT